MDEQGNLCHTALAGTEGDNSNQVIIDNCKSKKNVLKNYWSFMENLI